MVQMKTPKGKQPIEAQRKVKERFQELKYAEIRRTSLVECQTGNVDINVLGFLVGWRL